MESAATSASEGDAHHTVAAADRAAALSTAVKTTAAQFVPGPSAATTTQRLPRQSPEADVADCAELDSGIATDLATNHGSAETGGSSSGRIDTAALGLLALVNAIVAPPTSAAGSTSTNEVVAAAAARASDEVVVEASAPPAVPLSSVGSDLPIRSSAKSHGIGSRSGEEGGEGEDAGGLHAHAPAAINNGPQVAAARVIRVSPPSSAASSRITPGVGERASENVTLTTPT